MRGNQAPNPGNEARIEDPDFSHGATTWMALGLLGIGLLWRTVRYLLEFPIWGDEAKLALNFAWFDYEQLTARLENCQVAPVLFLWLERTAFCWLGPSELSLRLIPYLAGIAALALYWRLTGLLLDRRSRLFAVGFLAVAIWPVSMSTLIKPYSFDLLMSLLLLVPAVQWLQRPEQTLWLISLVVLAVVALLASYPAVFVGGGISCALARPAWQGGWRTRLWFSLYNLALLAGFVLAYAIGTDHLHAANSGVSTRDGMNSYWNHTFPPGTPLAALQWFVLQTTGQMTAYPLGAANGGSALTVLFCLVGVLGWARRGQWTWLILLGAPLILNLLAAVIHRYPYGGSCRLCQHLAPGICIFAGLGVAALIERMNWPAARCVKWTSVGVAVFALIGLGGLVRDVVYPYRDPSFAWMRSTMHAMREQVPAADRIVVCASPKETESVFAWYWQLEGARVTWNYQLPPTLPPGGRIWGFHYGDDSEASCQRLTEELRRHDPAWQLVRRIPYAYLPRRTKEIPHQCELFCFENGPARLAKTLNPK